MPASSQPYASGPHPQAPARSPAWLAPLAALACTYRPALILALVVFAFHIFVNIVSPYELHRDALLYLAMGEHLRLWSMDFPPFIALLARGTRAFFGDSLVAIRLGPSLAHALAVLLAGAFAAEMGGGRWSQLLAAFAVATAPLYLRAGVLFQPVVFDQLWWTGGLWALARAGRAGGQVRSGAQARAGGGPGAGTGLGAGTGAGASGTGAATGTGAAHMLLSGTGGGEMRRWWLFFGVVVGLGLLTKFTILVLGFSVLVALLLTWQRRQLLAPWPWVAAALALALGSPSVVGQIRLGFPVFGQVSDLQAVQLARLSPLDYVQGQFFEVGPLILVAWWGAGALLTRRALRPYRAVGWTVVVAFVVMMFAHAKAYYIGPIYPALLGVGAVEAERLAGRWKAFAGSGLRGLLAGVAVAWAVVTLPLGAPILPPAPMARYAAALGIGEAVATNTGGVLPLPQDYADMLGWRALADSVARVYDALPPADRARAVILANNYGEAGAVDFYGARFGLPKVVAPVGSYWFFGPGKLPGDVVITVGVQPADLASYFSSVEPVTRTRNPWGVREERSVPIVVARDPYRTLQSIWPEFRGRN